MSKLPPLLSYIVVLMSLHLYIQTHVKYLLLLYNVYLIILDNDCVILNSLILINL